MVELQSWIGDYLQIGWLEGDPCGEIARGALQPLFYIRWIEEFVPCRTPETNASSVYAKLRPAQGRGARKPTQGKEMTPFLQA